MRPVDDEANKPAKKPPPGYDIALTELHRLIADSSERQAFFNDTVLTCISINVWRDALKVRNVLETNDSGGLTGTGRSKFSRITTQAQEYGNVVIQKPWVALA